MTDGKSEMKLQWTVIVIDCGHADLLSKNSLLLDGLCMLIFNDIMININVFFLSSELFKSILN